MNLQIDHVIETCLVAIFSQDLFAEKIYLKGGQALRIKEKLKDRFSADIDFSTPQEIETNEVFFELLERALVGEFYSSGLSVFDFKAIRRPQIKSDFTPDFWGGWAVEFKLIEKDKRNLDLERRRREALIPVGAPSSKIEIDISEHEYCESTEKIKVKSVEVNVYSRTLLMVEKIRAICQSHRDYPHKETRPRARDYFDIERIWNIALSSGNSEAFLKDCAKHLRKVFGAKGVDLILLERIFDQAFVDMQKANWQEVERTVSASLKPFEYYNETLSLLIKDILKRL